MQLTPLLHFAGRSRNVIFAFPLLALSLLLHAQVQASGNTLARVQKTGTLKLGYYADVRPFSYQDEAGKPAGYAIAICQEIAKDVKTELGIPALAVDFVLVAAADRFAAVEQGRVDLLCGPSVETIARRESVSYSIPIFPAGLGALMRADAPAQIRDVLSGQQPPYRPLVACLNRISLAQKDILGCQGYDRSNLAGWQD